MRDIEKRIDEWIEGHTCANDKDCDRYLPAIREWGRKVAKTFYNEGVNGFDAFTRMHQEMCHRYVEASKSGDPESGRILEDIKEFERMMLKYMKAGMVGYGFIDVSFLDVL